MLRLFPLPAAGGSRLATSRCASFRRGAREFIDYVGEVKFSGERVTRAGRTVLHLPECGVRARGPDG